MNLRSQTHSQHSSSHKPKFHLSINIQPSPNRSKTQPSLNKPKTQPSINTLHQQNHKFIKNRINPSLVIHNYHQTKRLTRQSIKSETIIEKSKISFIQRRQKISRLIKNLRGKFELAYHLDDQQPIRSKHNKQNKNKDAKHHINEHNNHNINNDKKEVTKKNNSIIKAPSQNQKKTTRSISNKQANKLLHNTRKQKIVNGSKQNCKAKGVIDSKDVLKKRVKKSGVRSKQNQNQSLNMEKQKVFDRQYVMENQNKFILQQYIQCNQCDKYRAIDMENCLEVELLYSEYFYCSDLVHRKIDCQTEQQDFNDTGEFLI